MITPEHHDALHAARRVNEIPWPTALAVTFAATAVSLAVGTLLYLAGDLGGHWLFTPPAGGGR